MRNDAEKDPATNPNALYARLLINQVNIVNRACQSVKIFSNFLHFCFFVTA